MICPCLGLTNANLRSLIWRLHCSRHGSCLPCGIALGVSCSDNFMFEKLRPLKSAGNRRWSIWWNHVKYHPYLSNSQQLPENSDDHVEYLGPVRTSPSLSGPVPFTHVGRWAAAAAALGLQAEGQGMAMAWKDGGWELDPTRACKLYIYIYVPIKHTRTRTHNIDS